MALGQYSGNVVFTNETVKDVDVSASIASALLSVPALYDDTNQIAALSVVALNATTFRVTSGIPITGTYRLVVVGTAPNSSAPTTAVGASFSPPTLDTLWTYAQARQKLLVDLDMLDETFVTPAELIGYFNEGIEEAESEILKLDEDYFLSQFPLPLVEGQSAYDYPPNCYAYKMRGLIYSNGSVIYDIKRFKRKDKFERIALANQYATTDDYRWYHNNIAGGTPKINLIPAARETAYIAPNANPFTPIIGEYIRHANRVPILGQYIKNWDVLLQSTAVDTSTERITSAATYVTGDTVKLYTTSVMPGGLTQGTVYYVIAGSGYFKLATTLQNALAGTAINLTSVGLGILSVSLAATQTIIDSTIIDMPEFVKFIIQWAKCRCYEKEPDPRLAGAVATLEQQRQQMVSTFTEIQQDDQTEISPDFSSYTEMS